LLDPALGSSFGTSLMSLDRMEIVDEATVKFHLKTPDVTLPYKLGNAGLQIVPHDRTNEQLASAPSGTGPFRLTEHVPGERTVIQRNETYWEQDQPYLDEVQLLFIPEAAGQIAALTSGTVDIVAQVGIENLPLLENAEGIQVLENSLGIYHIFVMRAVDKPFDDVRVRQAFKHAIDRAALQGVILQGHGAIGNDQPVVPGSPFWANVTPLAYDVGQAKQLLAEAGYPDGLTVTLSVAEFIPRIVDAAVALQEMLKPAGITLTLDKTPVDSYWAEKYMQTSFFASWWPAYSEPDVPLSLGYVSNAPYHESGLSDPKLDELITKGRGERDLAQRKQVYAEVQQWISQEGAVLIPYFAPLWVATRTNVQGLVPAALIRPQFIWLAPE
jgi:peptide/nickel transport system substrate-binding protein